MAPRTQPVRPLPHMPSIVAKSAKYFAFSRAGTPRGSCHLCQFRDAASGPRVRFVTGRFAIRPIDPDYGRFTGARAGQLPWRVTCGTIRGVHRPPSSRST
jgi:hypothetical protein